MSPSRIVLAIAIVVLGGCASGGAHRPGAWGGYPDRAARDRAWRSLSPAEQAGMVSAPGAEASAAPPVAAEPRSFRDLPVEQQERLVDEYLNATPERRREMERQMDQLPRAR